MDRPYTPGDEPTVFEAAAAFGEAIRKSGLDMGPYRDAPPSELDLLRDRVAELEASREGGDDALRWIAVAGLVNAAALLTHIVLT